MAELGFSPQSSLLWGLETSEGARVASEVDIERRDGVAGTTELASKPAKQTALAKSGSKCSSAVSFLSGINLPANATLLARTLDVPTLRLQAELLRVRYSTKLRADLPAAAVVHGRVSACAVLSCSAASRHCSVLQRCASVRMSTVAAPGMYSRQLAFQSQYET